MTPSRASTETVNAVSKADSFLAAIRSSPSSSQRSAVSARQIRPRASRAMKLMFSGVANCAASVRSPSFSRSSASQTTTILPARMSSSASSIGGEGGIVAHRLWSTSFSTYFAITSTSRLTGRPGDRPGRASSARASRGSATTEKPRSSTSRDGEAHAVHRDRALLDHVAQQLRRGLEAHVARAAASVDRRRRARRRRRGPARCGRRAGPTGRSGSSRLTRSPGPSAPSELRASVSALRSAAKPSGPGLDRRQADAVDRDRVALAQSSAASAASTRDARRAVAGRHLGDAPELLDEPGEQVALPLLEPRADSSTSSPTMLHVHRERVPRLGDRVRALAFERARGPRGRRRAIGAMKMRISSTSPASRNEPASRGPPSSSMLWMPSAPSLSSASMTRSASLPPAATTISAPAARSASTLRAVGRARRHHDQAHLGRRAHELAVERQARLGVEHDARGLARRPRGVRAVSSGSSASAVPMPMQIASTSRAPAVHEPAALLARDPLRVAGLGRDLAVEAHRRLEDHVRAPGARVLAERLVQQPRGVRDLAVDDLARRSPRRAGCRARARRPCRSGRRRRPPRA